MKSDHEKQYNREWMARTRARKYWARDLANGHCPVCSMMLISELHIRCRFLIKEDKTTPD